MIRADVFQYINEGVNNFVLYDKNASLSKKLYAFSFICIYNSSTKKSTLS